MDTHLQGRTIANSHLLKIGVTFGFAAVYQNSSFIHFHLEKIPSVRLPGLLNCTTCDKLHPDFKIGTIANTDGMGNCLRQPGQLRNQRYTLREKHYHNLLNFVYIDYSCCRDNVNGPAGRRASCQVFCSYTIQIYLDMTTSFHLP